MARKLYTAEQIINKLRDAEVLLSQGATLAVVWKKIGVSDCTYCRWRKRVRWHEDKASQAPQGVRAGKLSLEAAGS